MCVAVSDFPVSWAGLVCQSTVPMHSLLLFGASQNLGVTIPIVQWKAQE